MTRVVVIAALFCLAVPAAFAVPPAGQGKPEKSDAVAENPAKACKADRAKDPAAFKTNHGTNKNKANAFGKCVSKKAKQQRDDDEAEAEDEDEDAAQSDAAKKCKAERAKDPVAFKTNHGTNKNKANAFGKCVSKLAKQKGSSS